MLNRFTWKLLPPRLDLISMYDEGGHMILPFPNLNMLSLSNNAQVQKCLSFQVYVPLKP